MKPRIRKKGDEGYILEYEDKGKFTTFVLNPEKLVDYAKTSKKLRVKEEENSTAKTRELSAPKVNEKEFVGE